MAKVYERLSGATGTLVYKCEDCGQESILDISVYIPPSVRPRELTQCYHCDSTNIKYEEPETGPSSAFISYSYSSKGDLTAQTPGSFKELLGAVKKGVSKDKVGETFKHY